MTGSPGVLLITPRGPHERGGLAQAALRVATQAVARGERVHMLYPSTEPAPGVRGLQVRAGLCLHPVGLPRDDEARWRVWTDQAVDLVHRCELDLVHGFYASDAGYVATLAAAMTGMRSVVSIRGNDLDRGLYRQGELPFLSHALTRATCVTAVSRAGAAAAAGIFGRAVEHVTNSVDTQRYRPQEADNTRRAVLGDGPVLGFVGELRQKKGLGFLLPALHALLARGPHSLLLIGGVRADAQAAYGAFCERSPEAASRIHVLDYDSSPERLCRTLALCDLLVFPSLQEGTPNAVLQAMAAARPVLATAVGGHLELIQSGRTGALLAPSELDRLPEAIAELLALPTPVRRAMGEAARAFVATAHSPEAESAAYGRVYRAARARSSRTP